MFENTPAGYGCVPYAPETSKVLQVKALLDTAKEYGIEITKDVYDFTVKKVYGDKMDMVDAYLPMIMSVVSSMGKKDAEVNE